MISQFWKKLLKHEHHHTSIKLIKDNVPSEDKDFTTEPTTVVEINEIIKHLNPNKATGPDQIPVKIVKLAAIIIGSYLANIIFQKLLSYLVLKF